MTEINSFGLYLRKLREEKKLTQTYVAKAAQVSEKTYRRIEMDKAIPRIDTLEEMSILFKEDLVLRFLKYNSQGMEMFETIKEDIEKKILQDNFDKLNGYIPKLKSFIATIKKPYYILQYRQYILLIEGIVLYRKKDRYPKALEKFIQGILISNKEFSVEHFRDFSYSPMEHRLLMNIALTFNRTGDQKKYIEILAFIMDEIDHSDEIYAIIASNLGIAYKRTEKYVDSIGMMEKGINYCQEKSDYSMLPLLYYGKGVSEYYLNDDSYKCSFINAVTLTKLLGLTHLHTSMKEKCKNNFHFDVSNEEDQSLF
ncbi:helix-turn-helix transcriptional regulator [Isachenkonia alkalipeptolytica]|uniref:Helix-turn-helix transcriptional regulator n=1 Tax=Isachenkonia alkalipeptolytica TaxID=2565777 RepID=A0AA43XNA9_9CLOT|nr:helix-turn-helix domain-containing protein [Isachenkonia alkalipeptolytica]NBG89479.1 helix-turn-helix transcriptional regulator [Isachenkonia alkalipeptolytica]